MINSVLQRQLKVGKEYIEAGRTPVVTLLSEDGWLIPFPLCLKKSVSLKMEWHSNWPLSKVLLCWASISAVVKYSPLCSTSKWVSKLRFCVLWCFYRFFFHSGTEWRWLLQWSQAPTVELLGKLRRRERYDFSIVRQWVNDFDMDRKDDWCLHG